jgi:S-adenosylmethionine hydrolase
VLRYAVPAFPPGTIHVAVVDPGVGSGRRPLLIEAEGSFFIGPDNGLLSLALEGKKTGRIIHLANQSYHLKPTSATFHGRDIFAPVAAYLSLGIGAGDFGEEVDDFTRLEWPELVEAEGGLIGKVIYIDTFGNLVTNIRESDLGDFGSRGLTISVAGATAHGLASSYSSEEAGYAAIINSWGLLEIFSFSGNAQLLSGAKLGDTVSVRRAEAKG